MTSVTQGCPQCASTYTYQDRDFWICSECAHEWVVSAPQVITEEDNTVRDAYGTPLQTGDSISIIKDLKIKGSSSVVKVGTKVKNIRLIADADGHNIGCKIEGFGAMNLKSEFVKKS